MRMNMECASASLANARVVRFVQHRNVRVLVWSMCEWSGFYNTGICECLLGQCASGPVFTSPKCASAIVWSMCEWSNFLALQYRNVRVV